jgi:hypothetical protein
MRDPLVVVSGYNDELRAKIIGRWQELEVAISDAGGAPWLSPASPIYMGTMPD